MNNRIEILYLGTWKNGGGNFYFLGTGLVTEISKEKNRNDIFQSLFCFGSPRKNARISLERSKTSMEQWKPWLAWVIKGIILSIIIGIIIGH